MSAALDPVLLWSLRLALAALLLAAAVHKLRAPAVFRRALADYRLLPAGAVAPTAFLLPAVEGLAGIGLCTPVAARAAAAVAAGLFALYGAAIAVNLARGRRDIDCGCAGPGARRPLGAELVLRNALLVGLAVWAGQTPAARALGWLDVVSVAAAVGSAALLYAAVEGLFVHAARLRAWTARRERSWSTR